MIYMGSRIKTAPVISSKINSFIRHNNIDTFIDCFVGGANVIDKIICKNKIGIDICPTIIQLHKAAQKNFESNISYRYITKTDWINAKKIYENFKYFEFIVDPPFEIAPIQWYSSFSAGGFSRGFANPKNGRDYFRERRNNHKQQAIKNTYKDIKFQCDDAFYTINRNIKYNKNIKQTLLYCDAPHKSKGFNYDNIDQFDYDYYYEWLEKTSEVMPIFVSEKTLPSQFDEYVIWDNQEEKLWLIDRRSNP